MSGVRLKGTKQGIVLIVDLNHSLSGLKSDLTALLKETSEYFNKNAVSLSFNETGELEDAFKIREIQKLVLDCGFIIDSKVNIIEEKIIQEKSRTKIIRSSLRAGNKFKFDGNIILFGDLNAGAKIEVTGSFICIGNVYGVVHAGQKSSEDGEYSNPCTIPDAIAKTFLIAPASSIPTKSSTISNLKKSLTKTSLTILF